MKIKWVFLFLLFWSAVIAIGVWVNYRFATTAGTSSTMAGKPPVSSQINFKSDQFNLITFIHPLCACSKATMENLRALQNDFAQKNIAFHVVFYFPTEKESDWKNSPYIKEALQLKNTEIYFDHDSKEFAGYDAQTSGQTFLFNPDKNLVFKGGITESRGHLGESLSMRMIASQVDGKNMQKLETAPTFGCENGIVNKVGH